MQARPEKTHKSAPRLDMLGLSPGGKNTAIVRLLGANEPSLV